MSLEEAERLLEGAGYKVIPPPPPEPERHCDNCGMSESDTDWERLSDITVRTMEGEEGFSAVRKLYCDECFKTTCEQLTKLGFTSHRHGTTSSLEDMECVGAHIYGECPTPTDEIEWNL